MIPFKSILPVALLLSTMTTCQYDHSESFAKLLPNLGVDAGESPTLDAAFSSALIMLMSNVTKLWYGTPQSPAKVRGKATGPHSRIHSCDVTVPPREPCT